MADRASSATPDAATDAALEAVYREDAVSSILSEGGCSVVLRGRTDRWSAWRVLAEGGLTMAGYDAFISYNHGADWDLAPAVRDGRQWLAQSWNR